MNILGTVKSDVELSDECRAFYEISSDGKAYRIKSEGKQAIKDAIFIRKGQTISIEGTISSDTMEVESAKIDISTGIGG